MIEILWGIARGALALLEVLPIWGVLSPRSYSNYLADLPPGETRLSRSEWRATVRSGRLGPPQE